MSRPTQDDASDVHRRARVDSSDAWESRLRHVATQPLERCPDFPRIAQRFEAWWAGDLIDRPILIAAANGDPRRPITRRLDLLHDKDAWLAAKLTDMRQMHWVADAVPHIRVDLGPVLLGPLLGGQTDFSSDTSWTHVLLDDDWSNEPDWQIAADNPWWQRLKELLRVTAAEAAGRFLVCSPDLGGPADVLLNLRGSGPLCIDALEHPDRLTRAQSAMHGAWQTAFGELYEAVVGEFAAGLIHWFCLWSNRPYHYPACDFCALIGPKEFQRLCLPHIVSQAEAVGRSCFHLDGAEATRHIDALLEVDAIQAIQFTPGAGSPSALPWVEMFDKIQAKGRSLLVYCPADEVLPMCERLRPHGLALLLDNPPPPSDMDALYERLCSRFGCGR